MFLLLQIEIMASYPFHSIGLRAPLTAAKALSNGLGDFDIDTLIEQFLGYLEIFSASAKSITKNIEVVAEEAQTAAASVESFINNANTFISRIVIFGVIILIMLIIVIILLAVIAYRTGYNPIIQTR
jgi:hypothetical protein